MKNKIVLHSIRWKFFAYFIGLGLAISLVMYIPYSRYIKATYQEKLTHVLQMIDIDHHHIFSNPGELVRLGIAGSDEYWELVYTMDGIAKVFEMTYIYLIYQTAQGHEFVFSSEYTPDMPFEEIFTQWDPDDVPDALTAAYATASAQITKKPYTDEYGTFISGFYPIIQNGKVMALLGADYDVSKVRDYEFRAQILLIISIIGAAVMAFLLSRSFIKPIRELKNAAQILAKGDLTQSFTLKGRDELAQMSQTLNQAQEGIKKLIVSIINETATISDIGNDLAANMNQTAAAVNEITANVQSVKNQVVNQNASVGQTHSTMEELSVNIKKLEDHVEKQNTHISQVSAAIEQMVANIQSVTETLVKNSANVKTMQEASEVGRNGLLEVAANIQEVVRDSEGLLEINSVMGNIASQTNLLSMNAAIEAAHAGEAGKGFAVVADEIRKLAESSSEQSKTIGTVLKKIKDSIDKITRSTGNVLGKFEAIDSSVRIVSEQEDNIRNAMEEQGTGSRQILEDISEVNEITRKVKNDSKKMHEQAKEVIQESANLDKASREITVGMNEMANEANQINMAVNHVNEISGKNRKAVDVLMKEVSQFKVE